MSPSEDPDCSCICAGEDIGAGMSAAVVNAKEIGGKGKAVQKAVDKAVVAVECLDLESLRGDLKGRGNVVMTRVRDEDLEVMDVFVEAGLFDSRSECAAFLIRQGIETRQDLLGKVEDTAKKISKLKEDLKKDLS